MIRILQVIGIMNRGGAETMIMNLYRHVDKTKVQFDFVEHTTEKAAFDDEILSMDGRIFHCPKYTGKNHLQYKKWWKEFFEEHAKEYSAVHGHIGSTAAIYLNIAKKFGLFTIAHSHSASGVHDFKQLAYKVLSYNTRNIADYFFACSDAAGIDRYGKRIAKQKEKYYILNNAIEVEQYRFNDSVRKEVRTEFGLSDELIIGHIGRFTAEKNHEFILEVFEGVLKYNSEAKLFLIGDGPLRARIQQQANSLKGVKNIIFTGVRSDVNRLLQMMDIFILPSIYEGLPVTVVEAQAAGLPIIISNNVPKECILTQAVTSLDLQENSDVWAKCIIERAKEQKKDYSTELKKNGFDINETAKWLEEFYLEHSR